MAEMNDYFRIAYVDTRRRDEGSELPPDVAFIRDWTWGQSATVRWSYVQPNEIGDAIKIASLVIANWSSRNSSECEEVCRVVRNLRVDLPILILESYVGQTPVRDRFLSEDQYALLIHDVTNPDKIASAFGALGLSLPPPSLNLHFDKDDLATTSLVPWVGVERLRLMIQKFFPRASSAYVASVGGGWSDSRYCKLFVDTDEASYYLKLFTRRANYASELLHYGEARDWLGESAVELRLVPDVEGGVTAQIQVFAEADSPIYPVCYKSASTRELPRETLEEVYHDRSSEFVEGAVIRILEILAYGQPERQSTSKPFFLTQSLKNSMLATLDDLAIYGPALFEGAKEKWDACYEAIEGLAYRPLPAWLIETWPVAIGNVHGDPNPRNCLVNPEDYRDVRLIDCGGYQQGGRLVSDLALIERDIKVVLLGTEDQAGGFFDLDVTQLPQWCQVERYSISKRLDYTPAFAPASPPSVARAYRLVGLVRERAKAVSGSDDAEGRHYFAALLYWTLDVLKYTAVRPTKKLLALYSAAEIIRTFE